MTMRELIGKLMASGMDLDAEVRLDNEQGPFPIKDVVTVYPGTKSNWGDRVYLLLEVE